MGALSPTHWLIIIAVLVVLFGAKRLPDAARSLGRSSRILKAELKEPAEGGPGSSAPSAGAEGGQTELGAPPPPAGDASPRVKLDDTRLAAPPQP